MSNKKLPNKIDIYVTHLMIRSTEDLWEASFSGWKRSREMPDYVPGASALVQEVTEVDPDTKEI